RFFDNGGDGAAKQIAAYAGFRLGDRGFLSFAVEYNDDDGTIRNATRPVALLFADAHPDLADQLPNYPNPAQPYGNSPSDGWKSMFNAGFDVSDTTKLYAFGNFAHAELTESFNFRSPETFTATDTTGAVQTLGRNGAFAHPIYLTPCPAGNAT